MAIMSMQHLIRIRYERFFLSKNHDRMTDSFRKPNNNKNVKATNLMAHTSFNTLDFFLMYRTCIIAMKYIFLALALAQNPQF